MSERYQAIRQIMPHLNGCLICAIDIESTGLDPLYHEIWQLALVPLNADLQPADPSQYPFLDLHIRPDHPERREQYFLPKQMPAFKRACATGLDYEKAVETFDLWFERLDLGENRRIVPLCQNWAGMESLFLRQWMGPKHVHYCFDARVRDLLTVACFMNDYRYFNGQTILFDGKNSLRLASIATTLDVDIGEFTLHDALHDCYVTARCYRKMLTELFL